MKRSAALRSITAVAIAVAIAAIMVPSCQMVGCSLPMGATMPWGHQSVPGLFGDCGGTWVYTQAPDAVLPTGPDPLVSLATILLSAFAGSAVAVAAPQNARLLVALAASPPREPGSSAPLRI